MIPGLITAQRRGQRQARAMVNEKLKIAFACPLHLKLGMVAVIWNRAHLSVRA